MRKINENNVPTSWSCNFYEEGKGKKKKGDEKY